MSAQRVKSANNQDIWYWHERDNELVARVDPFKKSHSVKQAFSKYFQHTESLKSKFTKKARFNALKVNKTLEKQPAKGKGEEKETVMGVFKRTAEAAGTVVSWGRHITGGNRSQKWTLESVLELALDEFKTKVQNLEKHPEFHGLINKKATKNKNVMNYYKLLARYSKTNKFRDFALKLVNYFGQFFELKKFDSNSNNGKNDQNPAKKQEIINEINLKKDTFLHQLGQSYSNLLIGADEVKDVFHHMDAGSRRLYSFTWTDQVLNEFIMEFSAIIVLLVFRSQNEDANLVNIKVELGQILRTKFFNPYKHSQIQKQLELIQNKTTTYQKKCPVYARRMSKQFRVQATELQDILAKPDEKKKKENNSNENTDKNNKNDDNSDDESEVSIKTNEKKKLTFRRQSLASGKIKNLTNQEKNINNSNQYVNLLPIHKRAAAERRIKGVRPAIAAVIHQKSDIITAALQTTSECKQHKIDDLRQKFDLEHNMYALNRNRHDERSYKDRQSVLNTHKKFKKKIAQNYQKSYLTGGERRSQNHADNHYMNQPSVPKARISQKAQLNFFDARILYKCKTSFGRIK